ncbi:MAG TPA: dTDP-4-dehydrorhamnose 3,5-epimerase [Ignavibacteria bacterium]|nr:dTDP-4-dehydrorhamnose 3,5-epimerase [Ignavibacteria bacterium]HMR00734.1 dTDP-4-dehydrorhamnose 3,5-epimerase [Ignavibacteria bacterium]
MEIQETKLKDVLIITPKVFKDDRGYFLESFRKKIFAERGIELDFVQDNISRSKKNTVRGLHYQAGEYAQGKLCQVVYGRVLDVAVDIRFGSPTFGKYAATELSEENHEQLWIPPGFAHGFSVLSEFAVFYYKCTNYYNKNSERAIVFNDKELNIDWNIADPLVSEKDLEAPLFRNIEKDFIYNS